VDKTDNDFDVDLVLRLSINEEFVCHALGPPWACPIEIQSALKTCRRKADGMAPDPTY